MTESIFMKGINVEMAIAIKSAPVTLDLAGKVSYAQRMWTARNATQSQAFQSLLQPNGEPSRMILRRPEPRAMVPAPEPQKADPIDELTKKISELSIHMANIQN